MEYKQMLFDACSSQSEPRLLQLAALKDPEISKSIAKNVFITEAVAIEIFGDYPHELLSNISFTRLGKLNPEFMQDLFTRYYWVVPTLILPVTWFRYLLGHPDPDVRRSAASNPNLPKQFHEQCVTSQDTALRMGIASNLNLPYNSLRYLRNDPDPQIKAIANQNPGNFSLTIKLPNPAPPAVTAIKTPVEMENGFVNGHGTVNGSAVNGAAVNGIVKDFVDPSMTEIQVFDASRSTALTQLQPHDSSPVSRGLPMLIIAALSLLSLGLLATLWSLLGQRGSVTPFTANLQVGSQAGKPLATDKTAIDKRAIDKTVEDLANMNRAIEIANAASLAAKQFPDKPGWKAISNQWTEAIAVLNKIPSDSKIYTAAQSKIRSYQVILATATQNARQ
jgi:hypothetical protein